ncbi:MAG: RNA polymerase factor sigma-54 [Parvularculaceae bacterium]
MALAPRLELRQSQQLVMTPQLQQAIKLLQLSNLELSEYVEQQLEENPFLERASDDADADAGAEGGEAREAGGEDAVAAIDLTRADTMEKASEALDRAYDEPEDLSARQAEAGVEAYKDNEWASAGSGKGGFDDDREFGETLRQDKSLRDHLTEQLQVATKSPELLFIGAYIIDFIDEAGYLREPISQIAERLGANVARVEETLALIHAFEPSGVGARDLKECMRLQLKERNRLDPAMDAFIENIELLAKGDLKGLMKETQADEEDVRDMIAEVRSLTPKPGLAYGADPVQIVTPDVYIRKAPDGGWKIELNSDTLPKVLVNQTYFAKVSKTRQTNDDATFVQEQFANANWLTKSLDQRARTILKVASEIVRQQDGFLEYGVRSLRPLNLKVVADALSMHESTVSRVTSNKYVATPRGIFELKYFFTASIASTGGGEAHSAEAVRYRIRELIDGEAANAVLSDDRIVELLSGEGVDIARRTVAKYRETMGIPSSVQRRRDAMRAAI